MSGKPYAEVIGDPISHSKSPLIHNFWLGKLGIDAEYRAFHVRPGELADYFARRRGDAEWRGCNVTMPHKQAVMPMLDFIELGVVRIGAVNTVTPDKTRKLHGHNTDGEGFLEPLGNRKFSSISVIGAGGAARAVLSALADSGVEQVTLQNRSIAKGKALLAEFGLKGKVVAPGAEVPKADLLANTSPLGMTNFSSMPGVEKFVKDGGLVYDIVTSPLETELLKRARSRGQNTIDGLAMLIGQAAVAFEKFFGQPAPRQFDAELRALLTA